MRKTDVHGGYRVAGGGRAYAYLGLIACVFLMDITFKAVLTFVCCVVS
jgi:hypothetical protein